MNSTTIQKLVNEYAKLETIPLSAATKLIAILETANNEVLSVLFKNRVKFCWMVAYRILADRGIEMN